MKTYMTSDLYLSAFLKAKGLKLITNETNGKKVTFVFEDRKDREQLVRSFFNNGSVNITDFKGALQDLKTIVFHI